MIRRLLSYGALLGLSIALPLAGCKDSPAGPGDSGLVGTWKQTALNNVDVAEYDVNWTITADRITYKRPYDDCTSELSYKKEGNKLITTVITDGCFSDPAGKKDTVDYVLSGDQITLTKDGNTTTLKKGTVNPSPSVIGTWQINTINGQSLPNGSSSTLTFTKTLMTQRKTINGTSCDLAFAYERTSTKLNLEVASDECETGLPIGATDVATYSVNGSTLTVTFSDGTKIVATRQ